MVCSTSAPEHGGRGSWSGVGGRCFESAPDRRWQGAGLQPRLLASDPTWAPTGAALTRRQATLEVAGRGDRDAGREGGCPAEAGDVAVRGGGNPGGHAVRQCPRDVRALARQAVPAAHESGDDRLRESFCPAPRREVPPGPPVARNVMHHLSGRDIQHLGAGDSPPNADGELRLLTAERDSPDPPEAVGERSSRHIAARRKAMLAPIGLRTGATC